MRDTLRMPRVYLAGPPLADEYRRRAAALVRELGWEPVDPMRRDFRGRTEGNEREIVEGDLADIDACDAVLAAFTEPDEGTAMEAWYAHTRGKPVIAWTGDAWAHPWTVYVSRSVHVRLEDAVNALGGYEKTGDEIGAGVSVIVVDAAPGDGPALHRHTYREVFVVLEGEATFTLGDETRVVHGGEIVVAPAGIPHKFVNSGSGRLRQVDVHEHPHFDTEWL